MGYEKNSPEPEDDGDLADEVVNNIVCAVRSPEPEDDSTST